MKVLNKDEKKEYDEFIVNHVLYSGIKSTSHKGLKPPKDFEPLWKEARVIL